MVSKIKNQLFFVLIFLAFIKVEAQNFTKAPILITPEEDWEITRQALSFRYVAPNENSFKNEIKDNFDINKSGASVNLKKHSAQKAVYRIQIATKKNFASSKIKYNKHIKMWSRQHGTTQHVPDMVLPAGTYFWRMRCEVGSRTGPWSSARKIKLVNRSNASSPRYNISRTNPLFMIADADTERIFANDSQLFADFKKNAFSKNDFSSGKRKHVAVIPDDRTKTTDRFEKANNYSLDAIKDNLDKIKNWGYKTMVFHQYSLAEQDWVYNNYSNCIGTYTGETEDLVRLYGTGGSDGFNEETYRYLERSLQLAKIHGGYFMNAKHFATGALVARDDEPYFHNSTVDGLLDSYKNQFILGAKDTSTKAKHIQESYYFGLWLDGKIKNHCVWIENYFQRDASDAFPSLYPVIGGDRNDTYTPVTLMAKEILYGAANGATVFVIRDNDNSTDNGKTRSVLRDHIFKLFEKIIDEELIASLSQMRAKNDRALRYVTSDQNGSRDKSDITTIYQKYEPLYHKLFSIRNFGKEKMSTDLIPDNGGAYGMFPIVSKFGGASSSSWSVTRHTINQVDSNSEVNSLFNNAAPHSGSAWVSKNGNNYIILNSYENNQREVGGNILDNQNYNISFSSANYINKIKGNVNFSTYVVAKVLNSGNRMRLFANTHRYDQHLIKNGLKTVDLETKNTVITVNADSKPDVSTTPSSALVSANWNNTKKEMKITVKHLKSYDDIVTIDVRKPSASTLVFVSDKVLDADQEEFSAVTISPNPAEDVVNFGGKFNTWNIKDVNGQTVLSGSSSLVNTSELSSGMYFVIFDTGTVEKLIIK